MKVVQPLPLPLSLDGSQVAADRPLVHADFGGDLFLRPLLQIEPGYGGATLLDLQPTAALDHAMSSKAVCLAMGRWASALLGAPSGADPAPTVPRAYCDDCRSALWPLKRS